MEPIFNPYKKNQRVPQSNRIQAVYLWNLWGPNPRWTWDPECSTWVQGSTPRFASPPVEKIATKSCHRNELSPNCLRIVLCYLVVQDFHSCFQYLPWFFSACFILFVFTMFYRTFFKHLPSSSLHVLPLVLPHFFHLQWRPSTSTSHLIF